MNTSLSWIKMYVPDLDVTAQEYTDAMTLSGTKVENYERLDEHLEKIVIGQIEKIEKHPDADKLIVCQVNVGTETVQIVTGAPNVKEGDKVPVVLDGGMVAGDHDGNKSEGGTRIKAGKLRGVESYGMMCSIEELGSSREFYPEAPEYGIYIFPEDAVVGESAIHALGLDDTIIEYEITSNRVDCYSVIGIAREAAATFHKKFCPPQVKETGNNENAADYIKVQVEDTELCPRYCARVVKNVKIGPSPKWMQRALAANGIRPINNLVDITNYVMEEYGQPMHAYDLDTIAGRQIIVRRAEKDEKFVTLDGQERTMDENVLMICDAEKAVGIAAMVKTQHLPMQKIAEKLEEELHVKAVVAGVEAVMASLGAMTTPGTQLPLAILEMGGGSTDAAILEPDGSVRTTHQAGAGELVSMLIQTELGLESRAVAEQIKRYPMGKVESLFHMRLENGSMRFFEESIDPRYYGHVVLLAKNEMIRIEEDIPMEKILEVRREAKRKVFVRNAVRALAHVAPDHDLKKVPNVVLVGGSAEDFEIPEMLTEELAEYRIVCGRGNIRGTEGPRNAVATGLVMSYLTGN